MATTFRKRKNLDLAVNGEDDSIESSSDGEGETPSIESSDDEENLDVKKVRLAREYLNQINDVALSDDDSSDNDDDDSHDAVGRKLQRDRLKKMGTLERDYADQVAAAIDRLQLEILKERPALLEPEEAFQTWIDTGHMTLWTGHSLTPTCLAVSRTTAVSGSKDHSVIVWDLETGAKKAILCPKWNKKKPLSDRNDGQVLAVACADNGRYAVVGKRDATVTVFDLASAKSVKVFEGHKAAISALCFRSGSLQLFSASEDRCIRHYSLDEMLYLETLYGHQFGVTGMDCHRKERPISVGRDRTARAWKVTEDSHLIFRGGAKLPSADCVAVLKDDWFVTGHENGSLCLWMTEKKKAAAVYESAHAKGIVSLACIYGSDLVVSGSNDGYLNFWKIVTGKERSIELVTKIPVHGFINAICVTMKYCVLAVGQEHRGGRWERVVRAKNRIALIRLEQAKDKTQDQAIEHAEGD